MNIKIKKGVLRWFRYAILVLVSIFEFRMKREEEKQIAFDTNGSRPWKV